MSDSNTIAAPAEPRAAAAPRPIQDLRQWLDRAEDIGELVRVSVAVDPAEEMSAVAYLLAKRQPSPALLFEKARGFEHNPLGVRLLWNILGPSLKRTALSLEEPADTPTVELIRRVKEKFKTRIPPKEVPRSEAPVYEHTLTGSDIDLTLLPFRGTGHSTVDATPERQTR
jgi:4-hydroxy-3-polyprenylbenzoate decarboxylase